MKQNQKLHYMIGIFSLVIFSSIIRMIGDKSICLFEDRENHQRDAETIEKEREARYNTLDASANELEDGDDDVLADAARAAADKPLMNSTNAI